MAAPDSSSAPKEPFQDPNDVEIVPDDAPYSGEDPAFLTETDAASSTQSLSSSVLSYQYENGRRYHGFREGEYIAPNDDREQERMDLHHHIYRIAVGGDLFRAPVDLNKARVLDLGTGTGIWAVDVADEYPGATVIGTDLSPIQPGWVPPNCFFEVDDFESDWGFSRPFNFIHGRTLAGSVRDGPRLCQQAYSNLQPGGWFELADFLGDEFFSDDGTLQNAPSLVEWARLNTEAFHRFGKEIGIAKDYKKHIIDAGFKNVREEVYKVRTFLTVIFA
ncbi:Methyltransferase [Aspergillus sp. HF37]|nr:Methyltransferase [Aspergillus sp. HF37]